MATIENLPQELIANYIAEEPSIFDYLNHSDKTNFSIALAGTIHEEFITQKFLKPQLETFASLDLNLKESLRNEGWFEECQDTKLIVRLWKEFKPSLPGIAIKISNMFDYLSQYHEYLDMNYDYVIAFFGVFEIFFLFKTVASMEHWIWKYQKLII